MAEEIEDDANIASKKKKARKTCDLVCDAFAFLLGLVRSKRRDLICQAMKLDLANCEALSARITLRG